MPHTESRYQQDLAFNDARLFVSASDILSFGTTTLTRDSAGLVSYHQPASQTVQYDINVTSLLIRRTGFFEDIQEEFGPSNYNSPSASAIAGSAQIRTYRPDVIGAMSAAQQLNPRTALKTKGIKFKSYDVAYLISTLALTSQTTTVVQTVFANNVANASTVLLASAANGLQTAVQANPYVTNVAISPAPAVDGYFITPDQEVGVELVVVTPATSTYILYGIDLIFDFNYN